MTKGKIFLCFLPLLATAYYGFGLLPIHLYREVVVFHLGWTTALGSLWYRAVKPSRKIAPNLLTAVIIVGCVYVADWNLSYECRRSSEEIDRIVQERLGAGPGDSDTPRDPRYELWFQAEVLREWNALEAVRSIVVRKDPGWCKATGLLARQAGMEMPRIVNWTADRPFYLCTYPSQRGCLPFPVLSHFRTRLRIERELLASAIPVRDQLIGTAR